jgi:hypothetical protein
MNVITLKGTYCSNDLLNRKIYNVTIGTAEYSLAQQHVCKLKPGYMFQLYCHLQAYLQSLVELYTHVIKCVRCVWSQ